MHIAVTVEGADSGMSGLSTYIRELYQVLVRHPDISRVTVFGPHDMTSWLGGLTKGHAQVVFVPTPSNMTTRSANVIWHQTSWALQLARKYKPDVVHFPVANRRIAYIPGIPTVGTVHDLAELRGLRGYGVLRNLYLRRVVVPMFALLNQTIFISKKTAADLSDVTRLSTRKHSIIYQGIDHRRFFPGDKEQARAQVAQEFSLTDPFVFFPSRLEHPTKNHLRLFEAFMTVRKRLGNRHRLVLSGALWPGAEPILSAIENYTPAVIYLGHVSQNWLPALYAAAECMVFPSLYEGFGLPLLEAMACGTPVVTSTGGALQEIAGDAAVVFDPTNVQEMENQLFTILSNPDWAATITQRGLSHAAGFTWESTAEQTLRCFHAAKTSKKGWKPQ
ncbi:MAG: glycosyltransferase family 4 protein [Myxococcales bacterium]|nr:glycosyltransferase family 4 protein [Myxococcales bacterium]